MEVGRMAVERDAIALTLSGIKEAADPIELCGETCPGAQPTTHSDPNDHQIY